MKFQKILSNALSTVIALQLVVVIALVFFSWTLHQDLQQLEVSITKIAATPNTAQKLPEFIENWKEQIHAHNPGTGDANAKVTVIEYSDYQCPFCKMFNDTTRKTLLGKYGDKVNFVFKNLPLDGAHPAAMISAIGAQCANESGKFWQFHDTLFEHQDLLSNEKIVELGKAAALGDGFEDCVVNKKTREQIAQDQSDASKSGFRGTPTFVINGHVIQGNAPLSVFENLLDSLM